MSQLVVDSEMNRNANSASGERRKPGILRWGFWGASYILLMRLLRSSIDFFFVKVGQTPVDAPRRPKPEGVETELLTAEQMRPIAAANPDLHITDDFIDRASERDQVCVLTRYYGDVAGYGWVSLGRTEHETGIDVVFGPNRRYAFKAFTLPEFRGKHLRGHFGALDAHSEKHGIAYGVYFVETHNFASLRSSARNNGRWVGYAGYFRLFGKLFTFRTPGAAETGFAFIAADAPDPAPVQD